MFEFKPFFKYYSDLLLGISAETYSIECTRIDIRSNPPSTRWGHVAVFHEDQLFIIGGRNEQDLSDMHKFDMTTNTWSKVTISKEGNYPRARRRHSCVLIESYMLMFGGFDGEFFNDLHLLDLKRRATTVSNIIESTLNVDLCNLINRRGPHADDLTCDFEIQLIFP